MVFYLGFVFVFLAIPFLGDVPKVAGAVPVNRKEYSQYGKDAFPNIGKSMFPLWEIVEGGKERAIKGIIMYMVYCEKQFSQ